MRYRGVGIPLFAPRDGFRLMPLTACGRHALIPGVGAISLHTPPLVHPVVTSALLAAISVCNVRVNLHHFVHFLFKSK